MRTVSAFTRDGIRPFNETGCRRRSETKTLSDAISTCSLRDTPLLPDCFLMFSLNLVSLVLASNPSLCPRWPFLFLPFLFLSPPFQKLEDWFAALSLNQELGIPLPAELEELHQSLSRIYWPKDGSPNQSSDQSLTPVAASPDCSSTTDNGT